MFRTCSQSRLCHEQKIMQTQITSTNDLQSRVPGRIKRPVMTDSCGDLQPPRQLHHSIHSTSSDSDSQTIGLYCSLLSPYFCSTYVGHKDVCISRHQWNIKNWVYAVEVYNSVCCCFIAVCSVCSCGRCCGVVQCVLSLLLARVISCSGENWQVDVTMAPISAVVVGAGDRGLMYSRYATDFPGKFKACISSPFYSLSVVSWALVFIM